MFDVIISGAGPAGSKCAEIIAKKGFKVALIERDTKWRKPCGGTISSRIFKYYPQLQKINYQRVYGISMYSADYHHFNYNWKGIRDYAINVDRLEFDDFIRKVALDAGAELFDKNISFDFITKDKHKIGIKTKTTTGIKEYYGKIIIIADGMSSKLANKSGLREKWKIKDLFLVKCAIMESPNLLDKETISIFFRPYKGYGWIFPLSETQFNIGVGISKQSYQPCNVNVVFDEFLNEPFIKKFFPSSNYKELWKAAYPVPSTGVKVSSLYDENIMIVGDAAGFVSPISGEGIHPSIVSGQIAAESAIKALNEETISKQMLKKYKLHPNIKKIIRNFKLKNSLVDFFFDNDGRNFSKMFELAEKSQEFREEVTKMFIFNQIPTNDFLLKLK